MTELKDGLTAEQDQDRRDSFRIDDDLSVAIYKIENLETQDPEGWGREIETLLTMSPPATVDPAVWSLLIHLYKKLDVILERLPVDLLKSQTQLVNLSGTGLRIKVKKKFEVEEKVKVKMLLPTLPAKEVVLNARVVRVTPEQDGGFELSLQYEDLSAEIQNEIIQYTLRQQRKNICAQRNQRG
jgi:hypothetical protein